MSSLPVDFGPACYGYWINSNGAVLNVEEKNGHVSFLMGRDEFVDLDRLESYQKWYETAFAFGWIRVVAPRSERQFFRFQYTQLLPAPRISLINLIYGLSTYAEYVFEASEYGVFNCSEQAVQFVECFRDSARTLDTATWALNCDPHGARSRA